VMREDVVDLTSLERGESGKLQDVVGLDFC
jgi:hypothetical protein